MRFFRGKGESQVSSCLQALRPWARAAAILTPPEGEGLLTASLASTKNNYHAMLVLCYERLILRKCDARYFMLTLCSDISSGLRPVPPPCLGSGSESSWMFLGGSSEGSRGPLGCSFEASWGPLGGLLGASWGFLEASWMPLGASWGPLGGPSERLWCLSEPPGGLLGRKARIVGSCSPLGPFLGPSWAVLGRLGRRLACHS